MNHRIVVEIISRAVLAVPSVQSGVFVRHESARMPKVPTRDNGRSGFNVWYCIAGSFERGFVLAILARKR